MVKKIWATVTEFNQEIEKRSPIPVAENGNVYLDDKDYIHNQQHTW